MTAFTVAAIVAVIVIGLLLVIELLAAIMILLKVRGMAQEIRDRVDPLISDSRRLLHTVNDVADHVKQHTEKVGDSVSSLTEHLAERVDRTSESVQQAAGAAVRRVAASPLLSAFALFAGLRVTTTLLRALPWSTLAGMVFMVVGLPRLLRALRSLPPRAMPSAAPAPIIVKPPAVIADVLEEEALPRAA